MSLASFCFASAARLHFHSYVYTEIFVPEPAKSDKQEEAYAEFARMAGRAIPERRIYSITFVHDGEEWMATVGEQLRGIKHRMTRSKRQRLERTTPVSDSAVVLALFPGDPYIVVTDKGISQKYSKWENPFMVGSPVAVKSFAQ